MQKVDKLSLDEKVDSLIGGGIRILNKAYALEKRPVDIGRGVLLYPSEFHLIETVGKNPAENLTTIASRLGVTKGAISQMGKKLEKKGLIEKVHVPGNKKDIVLELTDFGKEAFEWHRSLHESMESGIREELERMNDAGIEVFLKVYGHLEGMLDRCMERYR